VPGVDPADRDARRMRRIADGDPAAFEALYGDYSGRILAMLHGLCRDRQVAEDLLQEVFVQIWRKAATYHPGRGHVTGWIYAVARNKVIDHQRRQRPMAPLPADEVVEDGAGRHDDPPNDLRITLDQAMSSLADHERDCLRLAYFGGLTYRETAKRLGIPLGTLKSRIRVALGRLRRQLADA
jgi:RNA polymerase sigma-70 factor (ECF subfamily)